MTDSTSTATATPGPPPSAAPAGARPRVAIIMTAYNHGAFIAEAIESVLAQTYENWELLLVDDGSTDGSAAIVESFSDRRLRLIKQENAGPGAARNRGLREARGEFVAFLDADDEWLPNYLSDSVRFLAEHARAAAVISGYVEYPSATSREAMWRARGLQNGLTSLKPDTQPSVAIALLAYLTPCTTVARTTVLRQHGGFFERDHCAYGEDAHLWLKVLLNESVIVRLTPLAKIHFEASGATQTRRSVRPIEPFLLDPSEIKASCPADLRELLDRVLAIRAFKTACMLGYWGRWRDARDLVKRFQVTGHWKLPYYTSSLVCRTPVGAAIGRLSRMVVSS